MTKVWEKKGEVKAGGSYIIDARAMKASANLVIATLHNFKGQSQCNTGLTPCVQS